MAVLVQIYCTHIEPTIDVYVDYLATKVYLSISLITAFLDGFIHW